jgi:hypothetical protein
MGRPAKTTHFIRWDEPGRRIRRALCGRLVDAKAHSIEPTCSDCEQQLPGFLEDALDDDAKRKRDEELDR